MAARMMPAESVFGGFRKMVRDLAGSEGKQVEVTVEGLDCEADRLVLQRIKDPLMHILRNAVSHGIELPAERRAKNKDAQGQVSLRVSAEHDRLRIVVEDDGRGIDFARIVDKAVEQNRMSREEASAANEQALSRILFEPGFSTAESVTTISGRGVGLSIAQETVADLQGTIDISARPAGGTRTEVSLPVSILARRLLLVSLKEQVFALPCENVAKVMRVALSDIATLEGRPVIRLKDTTLPLTSIGELLGLGGTVVTTGRPNVSVVVARKGNAQVGIAVEGFVGVNDFVVRRFETGSRKRRRWIGVITTEDGTPSLVLNTDALLGGELAKGPSGVVFKTEEKDAERSKVILVVDDSITTRTLEKSILEAHGYRVRLSVDGRDALAQLRSELPDVVVSDIEMPHVDGFELLRAMKGDKRLSDVPVILVTSRSDPQDRERGLTLGADAYVVKQRFDQNDLLQTIRQLV
jgi:two-component system chemotaxis sensor kinase CheA